MWGLIAGGALVVLIVGGIVGFRVAVSDLEDRVVDALGPDSEIGGIRVGWSSVDAEELRIHGPTGWPVADSLRAERVAVVPSLRSLFSAEYRVHSITLVKPYLSALRTRDGRFLVVPTLLGRATEEDQAAPAAPTAVAIGRITLRDGVLELFDATVAQPPLKISLQQIQASVRGVVVPSFEGRSQFELTGVVKGVQRDGFAEVAGWFDLTTRDSSVKTQLRSVDLVVLQPYLIKADETGVRKGTLDLDLQSDVRNHRLKAPGKATLSNLELSPTTGAFGTLMGIPRRALMAGLEDEGSQITVDFVLEGDIADPQFSLNEALTTQLAYSLAEALGVSLGGLAKDVGTLGQKGGDAAGQAAKGAGSALRRLFGGGKKD